MARLKLFILFWRRRLYQNFGPKGFMHSDVNSTMTWAYYNCTKNFTRIFHVNSMAYILYQLFIRFVYPTCDLFSWFYNISRIHYVYSRLRDINVTCLLNLIVNDAQSFSVNQTLKRLEGLTGVLYIPHNYTIIQTYICFWQIVTWNCVKEFNLKNADELYL